LYTQYPPTTRGIRRRRLGTLGLAIAATLLTPAAAANAQVAAAATSTSSGCQITLLPVPDGAVATEVTAGDPTGRYLVGTATLSSQGENTTHNLLWVNGKVGEFSTEALKPYAYVNMTDVSGRGEVIGYRTVDTSTFHTDAWIYRHGRFTLLPGLKPTDSTTATAINSRGDVVGISEDDTFNPAVAHAVIWPAGRPNAVRALTVDGASPSWAVALDIDDNGTVLGYFDPRPGETPYVWPAHGHGHALTGPSGSSYPEAFAIANGWVVGSAFVADQSVVLRWNLRSGAVEVVATDATPRAVNRHGTVAVLGALVHSAGNIVVLPTLDGRVAVPNVVTSRGTAAGSVGEFSNAQAVIWTGC
jgi:uncharacterized membrane protein